MVACELPALPRGGHWDFRFCDFGYFLDRFFGFCCKRLRFFGFGGHCGLRIFPFFSIWFSVFVKNTSGFSVLLPDVVFGFSYFVLFWVPVSVRFEQHLISNSRETPKLFRRMRTSRASNGRSNCGLCCVFLRGGKRRREFSKEKQV